LGELGNIVGEIDVIFAGAKLAIDNNYVKPEIISGGSDGSGGSGCHEHGQIDEINGFIEVSNLRHPILESLIATTAGKSRA
jgi:hypothetical protein